jgi:hypothetical protein
MSAVAKLARQKPLCSGRVLMLNAAPLQFMVSGSHNTQVYSLVASFNAAYSPVEQHCLLSRYTQHKREAYAAWGQERARTAPRNVQTRLRS